MGRLFKNKSVVTLLGFVVCIAILFFAYRYRVDKATNAVSIPIAAERIESRTLLEESLIKTKKFASAMLTSNVIRSQEQLIGKYVNYNTFIPEGSFFYSNAVVEWNTMPDSTWSEIETGNAIVSLIVNSKSTFNSIYPGDKIDLYYQTRDNGKLVFGKFIEGIKVLAVKDSSGNHIFKKTADQKEASALIFSVSEDYHLLLRKAQYLGEGVITPVPRNSNYNPDTNVKSEYLKALILDKCENLEPDVE